MPDLGPSVSTIITAVVIIAVLLLIVRTLASLYQKVPPNQALVVFGGRRGAKGFAIIKGGGTIVWPFFESTKTMSLELMSLEIQSSEANSKQGVKLTVDAIAQVKISGVDAILNAAAEQLLSKTPPQIQEIARESLQGHLRGIIATMTVEQIYQEREVFQTHVADQAKADLANMGLEIISFTVRVISDAHGYMEALGKPRIAQVLRDAAVAEADADRETKQKVAAATQAAREAELSAEVAIASATRDKDVQVAQFQAVSKTEQAKADKAYDLQKADINAQLATREGAVAIEKQKQAALAAAQAIQVAQNEQQANVVVPAQARKEQQIAEAGGKAEAVKLAAGGDAEAIRLKAIAEAERTRVTGTAEGEKLQALGQGEAAATQAKLLAEAEGQQKLAEARAANDQVNLRQFTIEQYFKTQLGIGTAMAEALEQVGAKISFTQIGSGNGDGNNGMVALLKQFPELAATLNAQSKALAGKDLGQVLETISNLIRMGKTDVKLSSMEGKPSDK